MKGPDDIDAAADRFIEAPAGETCTPQRSTASLGASSDKMIGSHRRFGEAVPSKAGTCDGMACLPSLETGERQLREAFAVTADHRR